MIGRSGVGDMTDGIAAAVSLVVLGLLGFWVTSETTSSEDLAVVETVPLETSTAITTTIAPEPVGYAQDQRPGEVLDSSERGPDAEGETGSDTDRSGDGAGDGVGDSIPPAPDVDVFFDVNVGERTRQVEVQPGGEFDLILRFMRQPPDDVVVKVSDPSMGLDQLSRAGDLLPPSGAGTWELRSLPAGQLALSAVSGDAAADFELVFTASSASASNREFVTTHVQVVVPTP